MVPYIGLRRRKPSSAFSYNLLSLSPSSETSKAKTMAPSHSLSLKPNAAAVSTVKFLCSYGGKILPRYPDGVLRYQGGHTRVLSVDRSISFSELLVKLVEMCGASVSLRCQLPTEDLDALVSITSDEDLANLIEEYDRVASPKIRAFLSPLKSVKKISPPPSATASVASPKSIYSVVNEI